MTVEKALKELNENGFHIVQMEPNKFKAYDTGLFGFCEEEDPFIIDGRSEEHTSELPVTL